MSYDLYALPVRDGMTVEAAWEAAMDAEEDEDWPPVIADETAHQIDELAALLTPLGLDRFEFDLPAIASSQGISEDEARRRYRHAELNSPSDDLPLQITLDGTGAAANVPYWHDDERARQTYELLFRAFRLLRDRTGWRVFDPQLEREVDLDTDLDDVLDMHAQGVAHVREVTAVVESADAESPEALDEALRRQGYPVETFEGDDTERRPWWQFWRR